MELLLGQLPFWGLLGYMIYDKRLASRMTRDGLRSLTEKRPAAKQAPPAAPDAQEKAAGFPGDGYRPQQLPRRTG